MTILLADDQPTALRGLQAALADRDHPIRVAHSTEETLRAAATRPPRLLIAGFFTGDDGRMGMELLTTLTTLPAAAPILVRAPGNDPHLRVGLPWLGVSGLVDTAAPPTVLLSVVETLLSGGTHFDPVPPAPKLLTARHLAILQLLARGLPQKQVADQLGMAAVTLHHHLAEARRRLQAANTAALVAIVVARRILHLPPWTLERQTGKPSNETAGRRDGGTARVMGGTKRGVKLTH